MRHRPGLLTALLLSALGCEGDPYQPLGNGGHGGGGAGGQGPVTPGPERWSVGDCEAVAEAGLDPEGGLFTSLSRVHARARFFGDHDDPTALDQLLVRALRTADPELAPDAFLEAYVGELPGSCARVGDRARIGSVHVEMFEDVAWMTFGGDPDFVIPPEATSIVIDLTNAIESYALDRFLERAAEQILEAEVAPLHARSGTIARRS
jgi:hypothetical protein